jgi:CheY-like chemotaxis protein/two-component sensor histidine kinase
MVRLVDDLLEIARISNGKIRLEHERVDLVEVLRGAVESSMPLIDQARHTLALDLPAHPVWVDGDAVRLCQVFANLLNNAAKYTDDGGHIALTAREREGRAVVTVHDDGIGIPPGMLGDVFELYRQVPETTHRGQGGLGIGLAMVRRLVEMHGGTVDARSDGLRHGSEFTVVLPLATGPALPRHEPDEAGAAPTLRGCPVLIVDDNEDAAATLAAVLAADGADVRIAHDGGTALAELERYCPRAVLLDIGLPDINGYDVAQRIRAKPALRGVRLIAVTGWGQHEDRLKSRASGFDDHFTKPVDVARLVALLAQEPAHADDAQDQAASR